MFNSGNVKPFSWDEQFNPSDDAQQQQAQQQQQQQYTQPQQGYQQPDPYAQPTYQDPSVSSQFTYQQPNTQPSYQQPGYDATDTYAQLTYQQSAPYQPTGYPPTSSSQAGVPPPTSQQQMWYASPQTSSATAVQPVRYGLEALSQYDVHVIIEDTPEIQGHIIDVITCLQALLPLVCQYNPAVEMHFLSSMLSGSAPTPLAVNPGVDPSPVIASFMNDFPCASSHVPLGAVVGTMLSDYAKRLVYNKSLRRLAIISIGTCKLSDKSAFVNAVGATKHSLKTMSLPSEQVRIGLFQIGHSKGKAIAASLDQERAVGDMIECNIDTDKPAPERVRALVNGMMDPTADAANDNSHNGVKAFSALFKRDFHH